MEATQGSNRSSPHPTPNPTPIPNSREPPTAQISFELFRSQLKGSAGVLTATPPYTQTHTQLAKEDCGLKKLSG